MTSLAIAGAPTIDRSYLGRPIRVPLSGVPGERWTSFVDEAVDRERIRLVRAQGPALLVFPTQRFHEHEDDVLDSLVRAIAHANHAIILNAGQRLEARKEARQRQEDAEAQRQQDLADWWERLQSR